MGFWFCLVLFCFVIFFTSFIQKNLKLVTTKKDWNNSVRLPVMISEIPFGEGSSYDRYRDSDTTET